MICREFLQMLAFDPRVLSIAYLKLLISKE